MSVRSACVRERMIVCARRFANWMLAGRRESEEGRRKDWLTGSLMLTPKEAGVGNWLTGPLIIYTGWRQRKGGRKGAGKEV